MNKKFGRFLISLIVGVGMIWALLGFFTISPAQAQAVSCDTGNFFNQLLSRCGTEAANEESSIEAASSWLQTLIAQEEPTPAKLLEIAYQRVVDAGVYEFSAESEQALIPRARVDMIGQTQQRVDMHVDGEVTLPDYSLLSISLDGPGLDPTPASIVQEGTNSYLLRDGVRTPVQNPAGLTSPTGDYLNYLAAAENVAPCESVSVPFPNATACYTYDINGPKYAEYVRAQMQSQLAETPGAAALGINFEVSPIIEQSSGQGKVWLDEYGLPLRQRIDLFIPEADTYYDADVRLVVDYRFDEEVVTAVITPESIFTQFQIPVPTSTEVMSAVQTGLPKFSAFLIFLTIIGVLFLFSQRRWMYKTIAITMVFAMVTTPMLQVLNLNLFNAHRAYAAAATETFTETFVADSAAIQASETLNAAPDAPALDPLTQPLIEINSYQPATYCGAGGNGDRDGDGLADDAENCLGTNPNLKDSDGDGIDDGTEVAGFEYGLTVTQTWYSNPTQIDTNMDGLYDSMEWPKEYNGLAENFDIDKDGVPNLYDTDDDGDGVADARDISPSSYTEYFSKTVSIPIPPLEIAVPFFTFSLFNFDPKPITTTETVTTPIGLNITGQYNGYAYVDIQVQPQDLDHLRFGTTPLDWGYDDKGQIQEHNSAVDEDINLTPMLIVESNVAPSDELAEGYHVTPYKDIDGDGYGELMLPLYRVGSAGNVETFQARMAYGPDVLASLGSDGIHWRNAQIIWIVKGTFDKESEDGTRTQQELTLHTYEEPATRITGWEVTKSGPFESAIIGTPEFQNDDRALFQLAFGLNQIYLENPQVDLDEINARFSGANTPAAEKWGVTTTLAIDLPLEAYSHSDAGLADINNRIKSFLSDHYSFDTPNTVLVAYETKSGEANLDDWANMETKFSGSINLNNISLRRQRTVQLNMRDGWDPVSNGKMAIEVMKRVQPAAKEAIADLGVIYPELSETELIALTQAIYTTWEAGRTRILSVDGVSYTSESDTDQEVYEQIYVTPRDRHGDPETISTLPGYLLEVGNFAQKGSGLLLTSGQTWLYLQANAKEAKILGVTLTTASFIDKANSAVMAGLNGAKSFGLVIPWGKVELAADNAFFGQEEFNDAKQYISNGASAFGLVDTGTTLASAGADAIEASAKLSKTIAKGAKFMKTAGEVMGAAALVLDIGLAVTMFFLTGDFSMKAIARLIADIVIAVMLFIITSIPPWLGTVIAVVLAIFDLILSFCDACSEFLGISSISGWLGENLADYFYREVQLTELQDYSFLERNNALADEEMGFVIGNRFVITDTFQGVIKVSGSKGIDWNRVKNSAIVGGGYGAVFTLFDQIDLVGRIFGGPSKKENLQNSWVCGQFDITNGLASTGNTCPDKSADYELSTIPGDSNYWTYENDMHTTVPLNTAMHDFKIMLSTKIVAQTRWDASTPIPPVFGPVPLGRIHWTKERRLTLPNDMNSDQKKQWQTTPIYIDVLPATVEEFWYWGKTESILINHDPDGDGMNTKDEVNNYLGINSYANLKSYFGSYLDSKSPGDLDRFLANWDYLETTSYPTLTGYCTAFPLHAHICDLNSSPPWLEWDFDHDGLSDKFEYDQNGSLGTNAYKNDTDGDGLSDGFEYQLGTRIDKKDSDADGLTDDVEVYHPTSNGSWDGGWDIVLPKYGAVGPSGRYTMTARVFSDPLSKDTDGDGLSDYAEKENGTSPMAYNRVPRVMLSAQPTAVSPQGISAVYVKPGDLVTMTSRLEVYPPYTVSSTMELNIPYAAFGFPTTAHLNGSRTVPNTGVTWTPRWDFSNNVLQPWEYLYATTTSYVPSLSQSTEVTATLRLPYGAENQNQEESTLFVIDVENPEFRWMTPSEGELIGGGITHYVVGGTSYDKTTWVDELTLYMPGNTVTVTDTESFSPWAYTWELPADSIYTIRGKSSDYVGHTSSEGSVEVMIDNTAPTVDVDLQDGEVYGPPQDSSVITITLSGSATENLSGLTRVQISTDGGPWREVWTLDTATVTNTTFTDFTSNFSHRATSATWDAVWTLPNVETVQGYHSLRVRAFDLAGNWPEYLEREIIIDVLPPTDDLVNNAYVYDFPHVVANEPHTFDGVANDVGNVPDPSRPIELAGEVDGMDDATIMLGLDNIHDNDAGVHVAWIGDFNGDRRGDLVIGLPAADGGNGRVSVVYGRSGNWAIPDEQELLTNADSSFVGLPGAGVGANIMPAGDVNGDGRADLMIGDPANNRVFLVFGRPTYFGSDKLLDGPQGANWTILLPPAGQNIGSVLGAAGDVNGDGFADILVGAAGNVGYLILGQANPWWPSVPVESMAATRIQQGGSAMLTGLGDLDGDFYDEFAVGVNNNLYIFEGRSSYAPQASSYTYLSSAVDTISSADATPEAVALGDVDGDNIDDFIYSNGTSQVLHYGDATLDSTWTTHAYNYGNSYLAAPGDVDNDGKNDILIGNGTDAYLISSSDVGSAQATILGVSAAATTPYAAGADLNSDGSSDLLFVPEAAGSLAAATSSADSIADLPPTWVPQLPEQSLDTFTGSTTWPSEGAHAYVNADGYCYSLVPCFATIQAAVDAHYNSSTIFVQPGVYAPFIIDGDVRGYIGMTVRGMDTDAVIIDGNGGSYGIRVNNATAVNLENMTVRNASYGVQLDRAGINGHEVTGNRTELKYMLIYDTGSHDVYMSRESTVSIINSTLSRSSNHIGAYGAADSNIVVEWNSMANTAWSITDGGGAVKVDDVIYVNRGGGHTQFNRYFINGDYWSDPWGPSNDYEADSVIAAGSDDQVYMLGAPTWKDVGVGGWWIDLADGGGEVYAADNSHVPYVWNGVGWTQIPGSQEDCIEIAAHPENGDLYCLDYIQDIVVKWDGSSWTTVADHLDFGSLSTNDMAIDSNGNVHVVGGFTFSGAFENCYNYAEWSGSSWHCEGDFVSGDSVATIAIDPNSDVVYVGGSFTNEWADNITTIGGGSIEGVTDSVSGIDVGEDGTVYVTGDFTSTLRNDAVDQATPAGVASWSGSSWTTYPVVIDGDPWNRVNGIDIAETNGGEFYVVGKWEDPFGSGGKSDFIFWNGTAWEVLGDAGNPSNNEFVYTVVANERGVFIEGDFQWIDHADGTLNASYAAALQFPHEVYSTTANSWSSNLLGAPMALGDGASFAGDENGNLVLLVGGGRTDSFKYSIEDNSWTRVGDMPHAVNASAMTLGKDGYIYAVTDGSSTLYKFSGYSWSAEGPAISGATIDDGVAFAYDSHFGTYYVLPGGNGTKLFRYNPAWGSSWVEMPAERNTPAGVRPGAALVFVEGVDENRLYTAQGNYFGDNSTAFWMYPLPMPNKVEFKDSIIYAQSGSNWLNISDPLPEDFNFRVDANSRFFGGTGWTPTNMGTLTTTTDTPFLDAVRDIYRMGESGAAYTIGYHTYTAPVTATTTTGIQAQINTGANQVIVEPGIYEEDVYLVNGVELIGTNPDWTIIKPLNGSTSDALVRAMGSNGASFSRFTLDGEDSGLDGFAATGNAANLTVQRARIYDTDTAISLDGSGSDVEIAHVTAANNVNGLAATNCASIDVRNSIFAYHSGSGLSHESCATTKLHTYNLYWANASDFGGNADAGAAELFMDPSFVDPMDNDYRTLNFSPVIDAGNPTDPAPPGAGSRADIGYIEQGRVNFYVDGSYCEICTNDGLTWKVDAFDNIQEALDAAEHAVSNLNPTLSAVPQLIVGVAPGTYNEQISIPSHVLLFGSGAEQTILDGGGSGTAVTFTSVSQAGIHHITVMNADTGIAISGASNMVDIQRNIIRNNVVGVAINGRATGELEFNTLVNNQTGVSADGPGTWLALMHNIISGSATGLSVGNFGQLFTDYNLLYNTLDVNGVVLGDNDMTGQDPLLAGGATPYRLSETSPALDAAEEQATVPDGGGARADLGYSELLAAPVTLILGKEDLSTVMGNSGVASAEYSIVTVPDPTSEVTATLPITWSDITLTTPGETFSYWSLDHTPTEEGFYRFYSRATDEVGNQEDDEVEWYDGSFVVDNTPPTVSWLSPLNGASLNTPLELRAQVTDYAAGAFSVDENDVYFEVDGQRYAATWAAEPWDESAGEPRVFRAWVDVPVASYTTVVAGAEDKAGNVGSDNGMAFDVTAVSPADTITPTLTVALPLPGSFVTHTIVFSGTATDADSGVASVELSLDGGATWEPTTLSETTWSLTFDGPEEVPMISYPAQVRATDRAGLNVITSFEFTIDEVAPTGLIPVTFNHAEESHFDAVTDLEINWSPAVDASGVVTTYLTVDLITDTIATDLVSGTSATRSLDSSGDWYVHLGAMDATGNLKMTHFGPWHVGLTDGAFGSRSQSIIVDGYVDVAANEWRLNTEMLDDDERTYGSEVTYSPGGQQAFLTTWDANHYYLAWRGSHWALDGDLWIYLKAGGSGSNELIVPLASAPGATLPFDANYAIQITDPLSGTLYEYSGGWQVSAEDWAFAHGSEGDTEIRLPLFGTSNVETLAFGLGDDHNVWAIFPTTNPLNPGSGVSSDSNMIGSNSALVTQNNPVNGWVGYEWADVTAVSNASDNQPKAIGLALDLDSVQAPQAAWGPNSTLQYVIEVFNTETEIVSGQTITFTASPAAALIHDSIEGAVCSTTNPWECTLDPLAQGANTITLTTHLASDLSGMNSVSLKAALTGDNLTPEMITYDAIAHRIDGAAPEVTVFTSPFVGLGSHTFNGLATDGDGAGVDYVEVRPEFGSWQRVDGTELWAVDLTVSPFAQHGDIWQFEVRAADHHGQMSEPKLVTFTVDLEAPEVTFDSPTNLSGSLNEIMGTITDLPTSSEASEVLVKLDDQPWRDAQLFALNETTGNQSFLWTWNMPTEDGVAHTLRVQTKDIVGNEGSLSPYQNVWVDNVSPVITVTNVLTEVAVQHYVPGAQYGAPVLGGTVTDGTDVDMVAVWVQKPNGDNYQEAATLVGDDWQFTPGLQTLGVYKMQVRVWDTLGNLNQTTFYELEVKAAPDSGPNHFTTLEDTPITFEPLLDDLDIDSDTIFVDSVSSASHGTAVILPTTSIVYTPTQNFNGVDVFTYVASDGQFTDTATITVTVLPVNDPPQISGADTITATMDEDSGTLAFNFNGINVDDDTLQWSVDEGMGNAVISRTYGTGNLNADVAYTPELDFGGLDSFRMQVSDGQYSDEVTVWVTVNPVDDAPRPTDDYVVIAEGEVDSPLTLDVMDNDDEVDGQTLLLDAVGTPSNGGAAQMSSGKVVYTPTLTLGESETVSYVVSDGVLTETAVIHISVVAGDMSRRSGETMVVPSFGSNDTIDLTITIPSDIGSGDDQVTVVLAETAVSDDAPQGFKFAGLSFELNAYVDGVLVSPYTLANPITLEIEYSDDDVADIGKGDDELALFYWSGSEWLDDGITIIERDTTHNRLVVTIDHFTEFALFGKDMITVYLPMIINP